MIIPVAVPVDFSFHIEVSIPENFLALDNFENKLTKIVQEMANEARDFWLSEAGRRLKSSRSEYQQGISVTTNADSFTVTLTGDLAYAVENGASSYNMNVDRGQIVPLNVDNQPIFTNPTVYRTGTGSPWKHPGFPGVHIANDVQSEIVDNIFPKYLDKLIGEI